MKSDMNDLKKLVLQILQEGGSSTIFNDEKNHLVQRLFKENETFINKSSSETPVQIKQDQDDDIQDTEEIIEESLSLQNKEIELISKALEKYHGKRKYAAKELGISERTLYRKIKEYNID